MKFSIDTKAKTITLLEKASFKEVDSLKKFIGENWREWNLESIEVTKVEKEYVNSWWWHWLWPSYPQPPYPIFTSGNAGTITGLEPNAVHAAVSNGYNISYVASPDRSNFLVNSRGELGTLTIQSLIGNETVDKSNL